MNALATWSMLLAVLIVAAWFLHDAITEQRRERITQERHDANARTMRHIEAVRRGE